MAYIRQSRPGFGLGLQIEIPENTEVVLSSLDSGMRKNVNSRTIAAQNCEAVPERARI
jgi:hypothetical protein